jgi:hypothetical protein
MEARSSKDFACCRRATATARPKYSCDFAGSSVDISFAPFFLSCVHHGHRLAYAAASIFEFD